MNWVKINDEKIKQLSELELIALGSLIVQEIKILQKLQGDIASEINERTKGVDISEFK